MHDDDRALREQDLELRREELNASRRSNGRSYWIAVASVIVTAAVAVAAIVINSADSSDQLRRTEQQFETEHDTLDD